DSLDFYANVLTSLGKPENIVAVQQCDLLALLCAADLLIAILSNVIITAGVLGTPTLVCDFSEKTRVLNFVKEGLCAGCYEPKEVSAVVQDLLFNPESKAAAQRRLTTGLRRFNGPNDGNSHQRIASFLQTVSRQGRRWRARSGLQERSASVQNPTDDSAT